MSQRQIDLNADLAEGCPWDSELLAVVTSANICCGAHAGSPELTRESTALCVRFGVVAGAHPGLPSPGDFGRGEWPSVLDRGLTDNLIKQVKGVVGAHYVKPHGTLYNESAVNPVAASVLRQVLESVQLPLLGLPGTLHAEAALSAGVKFFVEGFIDRRYRADGTLTPRSEPGAVLEEPEEAAEQGLGLAKRVDSLCVHGDNPQSVTLARRARALLIESGFEVKSCF